MYKLYIFFLIIVLAGCKHNSPTEKYQNSRNKIVNVRDNIVEIPLEEPFVSSSADFRIVGNYFVFVDGKAYDDIIHLYDKNTCQHLVSTGSIGQGPKDITFIGSIVPNEKENKFYLFDQGKRKLLSFDIDSLIKRPNYNFTIKTDLLYDCPVKLVYMKDDFSIALYADFNEKTGGGHLEAGSWNMITNEFVPGYENPYVKKRMYQLAASDKHGLYVTTSSRYDLMTICNLDGSLKYNIYGPNWDEEITNTCHYNLDVRIGGENIYALYSGKHYRTGGAPTQILVFDLDGNYIKTLETGLHTYVIDYDEESHRLYLFTNDDIQFGYLDLAGII